MESFNIIINYAYLITQMHMKSNDNYSELSCEISEQNVMKLNHLSLQLLRTMEKNF